MREMVDKVKKGEPLYGTSKLSPYLQSVAARNSRYSELFVHVLPWFNIVNHNHVCPSESPASAQCVLILSHPARC